MKDINANLRILTGRKQIFTSQNVITSENVVDVLNKALPVHMENRIDIEYLHDVLTGDQPIKYRTRKDREEICNRIVVNHPNEIVTFKTASFIGEPLQYISRGANQDVPKMIERLNSFMMSECKASKDVKLAHWAFDVGVAYRIVLMDKSLGFANGEYLDEAPFEIYTLDPRNTFVIRVNDVTQRVVAAITYVHISDSEVIYTVYTPNETIEVIGRFQRAIKVKTITTHNFGLIPVVEYIVDPCMIGAFEVVIDILDAINTVQSNRVDGIEQFIQALMVFENCDIDNEKFTELKELGAIKISSTKQLPAKVYYLIEQLDQMQTQTLIDAMYQEVLNICGMPSQGNANTSDSSNNGAMIMKSGWHNAEARSKLAVEMWKEAETEFLKIILKICKEANAFDLKISEIEPKFGRVTYQDLLTKTQSFVSLVSANVPVLQAATVSGITVDPESFAIVCEAHIEKKKKEALMEAQDLAKANSTLPQEPIKQISRETE